MIHENLHQKRIGYWLSFFEKYQNVKSTGDYLYPKNSWEPSQKMNNEGPPEDVKNLIDKFWWQEMNEVIPTHGCPTSSIHNRDNNFSVGKRRTWPGFDISEKDKTQKTMSIKSSSADYDFDEYDNSNDDYESYQSDSDYEDTKPHPVSNTEFLTIFCETSLSRSRSIQQRRKQSDSIFDTLLKGQTSQERSFQTTAISSPTKRVSASFPEHSPVKSKSTYLGKTSSTLPPYTPSRRDKNLTSKSPGGNSSAQQPGRILLDITSTNKVNLPDQNSSSNNSSFSEHLNRMKIDSPSKPKEIKTPKRIKPALRFHYSFKDKTSDASSSLLVRPTDENKKQNVDTNRVGDYQRSPKYPTNESRTKVCSVNAGVTEHRETGVLSKSSTQSPIHDISICASSQPVTATRISSIYEPKSFLSTPGSFNSSGKVTVMDSSVLRQSLSRERRSIRALKKGRSLFEI